MAADPDLAAHVSVPDVIPELSSRSVLTSEFVPGSHIDKVCASMFAPPLQGHKYKGSLGMVHGDIREWNSCWLVKC